MQIKITSIGALLLAISFFMSITISSMIISSGFIKTKEIDLEIEKMKAISKTWGTNCKQEAFEDE